MSATGMGDAAAAAAAERPGGAAFTLLVASFGAVVWDDDDVVSLRARDASGSFGLLAGHADFLTALDFGVVSWRRRDGGEHHCAVRRGVLTMTGGRRVEIATREAVLGADPAILEQDVVAALRRRQAVEDAARREQNVATIRTVRQIMRYLNPGP